MIDWGYIFSNTRKDLRDKILSSASSTLQIPGFTPVKKQQNYDELKTTDSLNKTNSQEQKNPNCGFFDVSQSDQNIINSSELHKAEEIDCNQDTVPEM